MADPAPLEIDLKAIIEEKERKSKVFSSIGAFTFQFSQLEFTIRSLLGRMLKLTELQFDAVTAPYDFAILCTVTKIILTQNFQPRENEIKIIFNKCRELNDNRVRIAHGLWSDDGRKISTRHVPRQNLVANQFFEDSNELAQLTETAQRLMVGVLNLARGDKPREV